MVNDPDSKYKVFIGTSGYHYDDWREVFYPSYLPANKMLEFYSQHFSTVEINATYYTIPDYKTFTKLAERTPEKFHFIVKVNQETTHRRQENEPALQKLAESVKPLIDSGKFYGYLAQFPYAFKNNEFNRKYICQTKQVLGSSPLFTEFRNSTWNKPQIVAFLRSNNIGYVNVDEPNLSGLLPKQDIVTTETGYIRLHGRNEEKWWEGKGSERYDYEYPVEELYEWLTTISHILKKTVKTYIFFNNHPTGKAIKNAKQMIEILKEKSLI